MPPFESPAGPAVCAAVRAGSARAAAAHRAAVGLDCSIELCCEAGGETSGWLTTCGRPLATTPRTPRTVVVFRVFKSKYVLAAGCWCDQLDGAIELCLQDQGTRGRQWRAFPASTAVVVSAWYIALLSACCARATAAAAWPQALGEAAQSLVDSPVHVRRIAPATRAPAPRPSAQCSTRSRWQAG